MSVYRRDFYETKSISFLIKDGELFEQYNEILEKVKNASIQWKISKNQNKINITEKPTQLFTIKKYQDKLLNLFFYQSFDRFCF